MLTVHMCFIVICWCLNFKLVNGQCCAQGSYYGCTLSGCSGCCTFGCIDTTPGMLFKLNGLTFFFFFKKVLMENSMLFIIKKDIINPTLVGQVPNLNVRVVLILHLRLHLLALHVSLVHTVLADLQHALCARLVRIH